MFRVPLRLTNPVDYPRRGRVLIPVLMAMAISSITVSGAGGLSSAPARAQPLAGRAAKSGPGSNRWIVRFTGSGDAYTGRRLAIVDRASGRSFVAGRADPFVRPILSSDHTRVLYVRVRPVRAFPGARWSLLVFNRTTGRSRVIVQVNGIDLSPLGWQDGAPLYALARETQTGIYRISGNRSHYLSFLFTEPITQPSLAPGAGYIGYVTPADCAWCTLSIFNLTSLISWFGPTGIPSKYTMAWTPNGDTLVTIVGQNVATIDVRSHQIQYYRLPRGLPRIWYDPMHAFFHGSALRLVDSITGHTYVSDPIGS